MLEGYTLFDAFYMTLITITTVGYQEVRPLNQAGRIFNSFLIFFGVSAMFFAVGAMTQTIIELNLENRFGKHRKRAGNYADERSFHCLRVWPRGAQRCV